MNQNEINSVAAAANAELRTKRSAKTEAAAARKAAGLSLNTAAKLLRRSVSTIRAAETPGGVCTPETARKLAHHYKCSQSAFLTPASEKQSGAGVVSNENRAN